MTESLRLTLAQINPTVGDLRGNAKIILGSIRRAKRAGSDIVVFPELAITGYPPEDLLLRPDFVKAAEQKLGLLAPMTRGITAIVGTPRLQRDLFNSAAVMHNGRLAGFYDKHCLPNYGVFDENRYFRAGNQNLIFQRGPIAIGVSICEDIWMPEGPPTLQAAAGSTVAINLSSSPYYMGKGRSRERMLATRASDSLSYVAYCNLVGGQDELVFDGQSLVCTPDGHVIARGPQFREGLVTVDLDIALARRRRLQEPRLRRAPAEKPVEVIHLNAGKPRTRAVIIPVRADHASRLDELYAALVLGTRDYFRKNGFSTAILGLSGGIDSALTAVIAADALGPENVTGVAMPSRYSSPHSLEDARAVAKNVGMKFLELPIEGPFVALLEALSPVFAHRKPDVTEENLQARIRGMMLMALSNKFGSLLLTTGNKSEVSVGYTTLYGDAAGGFAVIKDIPKTLVFEIARHVNERIGRPMIPDRTLTKAPSAELRPNQKDSDSLPDYAVLDRILQEYIENGRDPREIRGKRINFATVRGVIKMVDRSEYKRRQAPPGVKVTPRAFGKDWRVPITNRFDG